VSVFYCVVTVQADSRDWWEESCSVSCSKLQVETT